MENSIEDDTNFYKTSKFDAILIGLVLFFSIFFIGVSYNRIHHFQEAKEALIYQKHSLIEKVPLGKDKIIILRDGQMTIEIKAGKIRIAKSDCPHQICVNMNWIEYSGQTIVCVPNQVVVEITSKNSPLLDAVSY